MPHLLPGELKPMSRGAPSDCVRWPITTHPAGYHLDPAWEKELYNAGILCQCGHVRPERMRELDRVVVKNLKPLPGELNGVWRFHGPKFLGTRLLDLIGRNRFEQIGRFIPVVSAAGYEIDTHVALIPKKINPGTVRTQYPDPPTLCRDCGRLGYWPNWPPSKKWYLLRQYWKRGAEWMVIGDWMLCSDAIWENVLKPKRLPRMVGHKVAVIDEPTDGLPADYEQMLGEIRRRGWVK